MAKITGDTTTVIARAKRSWAACVAEAKRLAAQEKKELQQLCKAIKRVRRLRRCRWIAEQKASAANERAQLATQAWRQKAVRR